MFTEFIRFDLSEGLSQNTKAEIVYRKHSFLYTSDIRKWDIRIFCLESLVEIKMTIFLSLIFSVPFCFPINTLHLQLSEKDSRVQNIHFCKDANFL